MANRLKYRSQVVHYLIIPEPKHAIPILFQMFRSGFIVVHLLIVDIAVDFDDEALLGADKVNDVAFEGNLAAKTKTIELFATEGVPELFLCRSHTCSKLAGEGVEFFGGVAVAVMAA